MGYCYDARTGRLACDACGVSTGVRKRTCPHKVTYPTGGSLPWCQPAALCAACYAVHKPKLHVGCAEAAAASTAEYAASHARVLAGDAQVKTRWGGGLANLPDGFVGIRFVGAAGVEQFRVARREVASEAQWLSDFRDGDLEPWDGPAYGRSSKEVGLG